VVVLYVNLLKLSVVVVSPRTNKPSDVEPLIRKEPDIVWVPLNVFEPVVATMESRSFTACTVGQRNESSLSPNCSNVSPST